MSKKITALKISFSEVNAFQTCPYKWWFRYRGKIKEYPRYFYTFGHAVHEAMNYVFTQKIETGNPITDKEISDAVDAADDYLSLQLQLEMEECADDDAQLEKYTEDAQQGGLDVMKRLITAYLRETDYDPLEVEVAHEFDILQDDDVSLRGSVRFDMVDKRHWIVEHKTSKTKPSENPPVNQVQFYSLAFRDKYGFEPDEVHRNVMVKYKTDKQSPIFLTKIGVANLQEARPAFLENLKRTAILMDNAKEPHEYNLYWCTYCDEKHPYHLKK